ncbi:MAG: glycosyltransferase family 9 protein [Acidobacteria bacterium]|nr:glycosyltransferase family 9 protein [Acidobacteriota bacterium]
MATDLDLKNILVMHFGQLGDVILGLPALQALREHFADAKITLMHGKPPTEVLKLANVADEYIPVDRVALRDGNKLKSIAEMGRLILYIRRRSFDMVVDLHSLPETNLLGRVAGIPNRLYGNRESRSIDSLSNFRPKPALEDKSKHATDRYLDVILPLEIEPRRAPVKLFPRQEDVDSVVAKYPNVFGDGGGSLVGLFPGAGNPSRCWPIDKFAALAGALIDDGLLPVIFLGPEEFEMRPQVERTFPEGAVIVDGLSITEFLAALSDLAVFVGNDTGPVHLAACVATPTVLLIDEKAPLTYLPNNHELTVVGDGPIASISVESVYRATTAVLEQTRPGANDKRNVE